MATRSHDAAVSSRTTAALVSSEEMRGDDEQRIGCGQEMVSASRVDRIATMTTE
jgi:hypothetical protein